jgi:hypothetical protein
MTRTIQVHGYNSIEKGHCPYLAVDQVGWGLIHKGKRLFGTSQTRKKYNPFLYPSAFQNFLSIR